MEKLLSAQEVADALGVPLATLYTWRSRRQGPTSLRVGRHLRYRAADIEAWLRAQQRESAA